MHDIDAQIHKKITVVSYSAASRLPTQERLSPVSVKKDGLEGREKQVE